MLFILDPFISLFMLYDSVTVTVIFDVMLIPSNKF